MAAQTYADVLRGLLRQEENAMLQAREAAAHHRAPPPVANVSEAFVSTARVLAQHYDEMAALHERRVLVLADLLHYELPETPLPADAFTPPRAPPRLQLVHVSPQ